MERLETKRLLVRRLERGDGEALFKVLSDPEVMRYIEPTFTLDQTESFIEAYGLCDPPIVYALTLKPEGSVIGHVIFRPRQSGSYEIGWIMAKDHWGRGYASEITEALEREAARSGVKALIIECHPDQRATVRLAERLGYALAESCGELLIFVKRL